MRRNRLLPFNGPVCLWYRLMVVPEAGVYAVITDGMIHLFLKMRCLMKNSWKTMFSGKIICYCIFHRERPVLTPYISSLQVRRPGQVQTMVFLLRPICVA